VEFGVWSVEFDSPLHIPNTASNVLYRFPNAEPSVCGSALERKKETADVQFSRLLRKPRKRNAAGFVPIVLYELEALTSSSRGRRIPSVDLTAPCAGR
jgi:hypothetical protein